MSNLENRSKKIKDFSFGFWLPKSMHFLLFGKFKLVFWWFFGQKTWNLRILASDKSWKSKQIKRFSLVEIDSLFCMESNLSNRLLWLQKCQKKNYCDTIFEIYASWNINFLWMCKFRKRTVEVFWWFFGQKKTLKFKDSGFW